MEVITVIQHYIAKILCPRVSLQIYYVITLQFNAGYYAAQMYKIQRFVLFPGEIIIQSTCSSDSRDYTKKQWCYFCGTAKLKMARHLQTKHSDVLEIASLPKMIKDAQESQTQQRKCVLDKYRNLGNFQHNVDVITEKKGVLIVGRRPPSGHSYNYTDYMPCNYCLVFYVKKELWRHVKTCKAKNKPIAVNQSREDAEHDCITASAALLKGAAGSVGLNIDSYEFKTRVVDAMHSDEISRVVKSDHLLLLLGKVQFEKLGKMRAGQVREKLRLLGRAKIALRKATKDSNAEMSDFLCPEKFDICIHTVKSLAEESTDGSSLSGTRLFCKPSVALKVGQLLKKVASLKKGQAIRMRNEKLKDEAADFLYLYTNEWTDQVSGRAHQDLAEKHFNKKEMLPLTSDLMKLTVSK